MEQSGHTYLAAPSSLVRYVFVQYAARLTTSREPHLDKGQVRGNSLPLKPAAKAPGQAFICPVTIGPGPDGEGHARDEPDSDLADLGLPFCGGS